MTSPVGLLTDFRAGPIDIDDAPVLTWHATAPHDAVELEWAAERSGTTTVRRASTADRWEWDAALAPSRRYSWRVRTVADGVTGDWSAAASFETAPLAEPAWHGARWIGAPGPTPGPAPSFSRRVEGRDSAGLRLAICGLGYADVRIDGIPVSDALLDPPPSAYDRVVLYRVHDVSALLTPGPHLITVRLGRGFYAMTTDTTFGWHRAPWRAEPRMRLALYDLDDRREGGGATAPLLVSDASWLCAPTPVLDDSLYAGEVVDLATSPRDATAAIEVSAPTGVLRACRQPPITRREPVAVTGRTWTGPDRQRVDLDRNVTGLVTVTLGEDATRPTLAVKLGEHLGDEGEVLAADAAVHAELQRSTLIGVPAGHPVALDLAYAGMRHVEVTGTRAEVRVEVDRVSSAPASVGSWRCSDPLLQRIHDITLLTVENGLQGTPIDTPIYEKQGYTGDAQLLTDTYAYNLWMPTALGTWFDASIAPTQHDDGSLPGIAPTPPGNWIFDTPSPAWDAALFEIPDALARHYGDLGAVRRALPTLRRYLAFLAERFPSGIVDVGLGDWNPPGHIVPPEQPAVLSTAYHHRFLVQMAGLLRRVGEEAEASTMLSRAASVRGAFDAAFWRADAGHYAADGDGYRETAQLLAVAFGLVPAERVASVVERVASGIRARGTHLDTGMVGTRQLLRVLSRHGMSRLAFDVVRSPGYPGWRHWIDSGATTLYENWELDGRSHNHAMFGSIDEWLWADVAGLRPARDGWAALEVAPHLPGETGFTVEASLETVAGPIAVEWEDAGDGRVRGRVTAPEHVPVAASAGLVEVERRSQRLSTRVEHTLELRRR